MTTVAGPSAISLLPHSHRHVDLGLSVVKDFPKEVISNFWSNSLEMPMKRWNKDGKLGSRWVSEFVPQSVT